MVIGSDEGSPEDLTQGDLDLGEQNGVINSSIPAEPVASSFAVALREKVMVARKESTSEILNLLSSSGPSPSASQHDGALRSPFAETPPGSGEMYSGENGTEGGVERLKVDSGVSAGDVTESGASMHNNTEQSAVNEHQTCVECEDQYAELFCLSCEEPYCRPCWGSLHRKGNRSQHVTRAIIGEVMPAPTTEPEPPAPVEHQPEVVDIPEQENSDISDSQGEGLDSDDDDDGEGGDVGDETVGDANSNDAREGTVAHGVKKRSGKRRSKRESSRRLAVGLHGSTVLEETQFIPLRLDERERGMLAMLKGALNVSEYTDRVDVYSRWSSKSRIMNNELRIALAALSGMMVTGEFNWGQKHVPLLETLEENQDAFADIFEVGRRYKITNPDKFRTFYGKMQFMLQDAQAQERSGLNLVKDIKMVYGFVKERNGLDMLEDDRVLVATADVSGRLGNKAEVQQLLAAKTAAREGLLKDYVSSSFSRQDVERVLDSIGDANNYIAFNVSPVERMLNLLRKNFHPDKPEGEWSLSLKSGTGGSRRKRISSYGSSYGSLSSYGFSGGYGSSMFGSSTAMLSHDHRTQYMFVSQSLRLWSEAMRSMYRLWYFADRDLVSGKASYRLCNTGQGLNRVQSCPSVSGEMRRILRTVQSECGPWVGLSVVHLGDRDVPNALVFIDKYTQIPRILGPIVDAVQSLEEITCNPILEHYIEEGWGGVHNAKMAILSDFFKGGFDGSGDDGGSCIDGRLTSAWNWCSLMSKKPYAPIFYLAGQYGFDGGWGTGLLD